MSSEKKPTARKRTPASPPKARNGERARTSSPESAPRPAAPTHEDIARRAYEIYLRDGRTGRELEHWLQAERELTQRL